MDDKNNLEVICLHQLSKKTDYYIPQQGIGNCNICKSSEENKSCRMYYPIKLCRIYVSDNDKEKD